MCQYPLEKISECDFFILAQGNDPPIFYKYIARVLLPHNFSRHQQSLSCFVALARERNHFHVHVTWLRPHSAAAELEINSTHGEFYTHTGRDEKLKNYFSWPND